MADKTNQQAVYDRAMFELTAKPPRMSRRQYQTSAIEADTTAMRKRGAYGRMAHNAELFCIAFAMVTPVLLFWSLVL